MKNHTLNSIASVQIGIESKEVLVEGVGKYSNKVNHKEENKANRAFRKYMVEEISRCQIEGRYKDVVPKFIAWGYDYYIRNIGLNSGYPPNQFNIISLGIFLYFCQKLAQSQCKILKPDPAVWVMHYLLRYKGPQLQDELFYSYKLGDDQEIINSLSWLFEAAKDSILIEDRRKEIEEIESEIIDFKRNKTKVKELGKFEIKLFSDAKTTKKHSRIKDSISRVVAPVLRCCT